MPFDGSTFNEPMSWFTQVWRSFLPVPDPMPRRLLKVARDLIIARRNWTQWVYNDGDNRRCAVGALQSAERQLNSSGTDAKTARLLLLTIAQQHGFQTIEAMNDHSTHAQVIHAFRLALSLT